MPAPTGRDWSFFGAGNFPPPISGANNTKYTAFTRQLHKLELPGTRQVGLGLAGGLAPVSSQSEAKPKPGQAKAESKML